MTERIELRMHFGGYFKKVPKMEYVDGECSIMKDMVVGEVLQMSTINRIHVQLDAKNSAKFYYRHPDGDFEKGLIEVKNDMSMHVMHFDYYDMPFLELFAVVEDESVDNMNNGIDQQQDDEDAVNVDDEDEPVDLFMDEPVDLFVGGVESNFGASEEVGLSNLVSSSRPSQANEDNWNDMDDMDEQLLDTLEDVIEEEVFLQSNFTFKVGQKFSTPQIFRDALKEWNIQNGYTVTYSKNENRRITAKCSKGCSWRIHASPMQDGHLFQVKSFTGEHTCGRQYKNKHCNSTYIAKRYVENVRDNPTCSVNSLVKSVKRDLIVDCSHIQASKAKRTAVEIINGSDADQYKRLYDFVATLSKTNPGTTCKIKLRDMVMQTNGVGDLVNSDGRILGETPRRTFERFYVCLAACKRGFLSGCRPVICFDGCFTKGSFKGQLLSANGRDGNDNMYPLAFALVESKRYESWKWFLENLLDDIGGLDERRWVLMSDRQKGLSIAIVEVFPGCEHRFCVRHMYENFKKKFTGLRVLFWKAALAGNKSEFNKAMELIDQADPSKEGSGRETAAAWLKKIPPEMWSRSYFSTHSKCPVVVNNICESLNSWILPARELPVIDMVNWIRRKLMKRIQTKSAKMLEYEGAYCPNIMEKLEKNKIRSRNCFATYAGDGTFEVICGHDVYVVKLRLKTCSCGMFELSGIPCPHAISAIQIDHGRVESYIDEFFKKDKFLLTYSFMIHPVPSMMFYEKSAMPDIVPPVLRKQPGRPKKLRRKDPEEIIQKQQSTRKDLTVTCSLCKKLGHNSRTCIRRKDATQAGGSNSQPESLRDFGSTTNANTTRSKRSKQSDKQQAQVTPKRSNIEEVTQKGHDIPPRRSPRLQSISVSTSQVPLKPHKTGAAMNLAQKFGN